MFQSFSAPDLSIDTSSRLRALRSHMLKSGIQWFLVPHADEHQNEYLPERAERLAWLTGFTGSAGFALVGLETAFLFVDGRYTIQAREQCDPMLFEICDLIAEPPHKRAGKHICKNDQIAMDPWLMTIAQEKTWQKTADDCEAKLVPVENLIDSVWTDQPGHPSGKAWLHPERFAGKDRSDKLDELLITLREAGADACLLTDPASIAWLFNLRGSDVAHNPLALAYGFVPATGRSTVFIDPEKLSEDDHQELARVANIEDYDALSSAISALEPGTAILCDPNLVSSALAGLLKTASARIIEKRDPVVLLRAIKNETELDGARNAHLRDGVAMVKFLHWLDTQPPGSLTEIDAAKKLEACRRDTAIAMGSRLEEISFDTISGAGANGAIVHYRVNEDSNAVIADNSLYLVDSGGQYLDGTTDITRTIAIGSPPHEAVRDNTLVLKGHIAIATARFPAGTRGVDIDAFARMPLWKAGRDYAHGTGHGIGSYLNVHEGPQSISRRGMEALQPGMILSNEPGFYREGHYGIRIENLLIVQDATRPETDSLPMHGFETITLCPLDRRLIDPALLDAAETGWLNTYHARVLKELSPYLDEAEKHWLERATRQV